MEAGHGGADSAQRAVERSGLTVVARGVGEEGEELLARDHDAPPELHIRDRALVDARGDRARINPERFGGFFAGDDQAAPLAEVVHVQGALPHEVTVRSNTGRLRGAYHGRSQTFLGNPFAGIATGATWLPPGVAVMGQVLPPGAAGTLVRSVAYFGGVGGEVAALTLGVWLLVGLTLWFLAPRMSHAAQHSRAVS